ncbi:MAG: 4-demethylwyosine synthase TYW1 [Nitrososphaerota archaeon]|nr:4-demethylwyosine synthase TYW1 [Nitrososphaerota archaeon]MDG6929941.1 4-demethylwyosine synthase TYW1 [Nitrososphaerota archaeon]
MTTVKLEIDEKTANKLKNAHYGVFGHSAVEICHWTKTAIKEKRGCYKNKFYGIETHRCMEMTPAAVFCENRCIHCWRPTEFYKMLKMPEGAVDEPKAIVEELTESRRKLLIGFMGNSKIDKQWLAESLTPSHYSISLSGEPTLYPRLPELILFLKSLPNTKSIFLVTNGEEPEMLEELITKNALPTQLYLSMNAYNREEYQMINRPMYRDGWERWLKSLSLLSQTPTRTVIRITLIRGYNDSYDKLNEATRLIRVGNPDFVEIKSYMHVGSSMSNLTERHMLSMEEVRAYTKNMLEFLNRYNYMDEMEPSRISVIKNANKSTDRWIIPEGSYTA